MLHTPCRCQNLPAIPSTHSSSSRPTDSASLLHISNRCLFALGSKLLERHICLIIRDHLAKLYSLLSDHQWGFRPGRSTTSALLSTLSDWHAELDHGNDICAILFDYRKAFDSVPHFPLVKKLMDLNFDPFIVTWVTSYLCDRSQCVVVNGDASGLVQVVSGVPQGSVLGPLLFCIYIDSVALCVQSVNSHNVLYADDLLLYKSIACAQDFVDMQLDVLAIEQWSENNHLTLNSAKCKAMVISRKKNPYSQPLYLNGVVLDQVESFKYLGVNISHDLITWSNHNLLARFVAKHVKLWVLSTDNFMVNVTRDLFSSFTSLLSGLIWSTLSLFGLLTHTRIFT